MNEFSYHVLEEPWIPVHDAEGQIIHVGIRDALVHAQDYKKIVANSPLVTYGITRLLITLLMDAYKPEGEEELFDLYEEGRFDPEAIRRYFDKCNQAGERFDLFDPQFPFLQCIDPQPAPHPDPKMRAKLKQKTESVTKLFPWLPYENNHVVFDKTLQKERAFSPAEALHGLVISPCFSCRYDKGAYFGIAGQPPVYFLVNRAGGSLFDLLCLSMVSKQNLGNRDWGKPLWRMEPPPDGFCNTILEGMYSYNKRIQLLPIKDEDTGELVVQEMRYAEGVSYKQLHEKSKNKSFRFVWKDPHASYDTRKVRGKSTSENEDEKAYKQQTPKEIWRDFGTVLYAKHRPAILEKARATLEELAEDGETPKLVLYSYVLCSQLKGMAFVPTEWASFEDEIGLELLDEQFPRKLLSDLLACINGLSGLYAGVMNKTLEQLRRDPDKKNEKKKGTGCSFGRSALSVEQFFLQQARRWLMTEGIPQMTPGLRVGSDEETALKLHLGKQMLHQVMVPFDGFCDTIRTDAKSLLWATLARKTLYNYSNNLLKQGGWVSDDKRAKEN